MREDTTRIQSLANASHGPAPLARWWDFRGWLDQQAADRHPYGERLNASVAALLGLIGWGVYELLLC